MLACGLSEVWIEGCWADGGQRPAGTSSNSKGLEFANSEFISTLQNIAAVNNENHLCFPMCSLSSSLSKLCPYQSKGPLSKFPTNCIFFRNTCFARENVTIQYIGAKGAVSGGVGCLWKKSTIWRVWVLLRTSHIETRKLQVT